MSYAAPPLHPLGLLLVAITSVPPPEADESSLGLFHFAHSLYLFSFISAPRRKAAGGQSYAVFGFLRPDSERQAAYMSGYP